MKKMLWVDLEMTGLDLKTCCILEVAAVVTDGSLSVLEEFHAVVHRPPEVLASMDPWCIETHGKSGLTADIASGRPLAEVETDLVALIDRHWTAEERAVLCGNSVGTDKAFIDMEMPRVRARLHYRIVDVSSFKEVLSSRIDRRFEKKEAHRARTDIHESIGELAHYLRYFRGQPC